MSALKFTDPEFDLQDQEPVEELTTTEFEPDGYEGYFHAAIKNGVGVLVDGEKRDRDKLIKSIEAVLDKLGTHPDGAVKAARGQFLTDVCRIFKLPTTIGSGDIIDQESVLDDLRQLPETIVGSSEEVVTRTTKPVTPMADNNGIPMSPNFGGLSEGDDDSTGDDGGGGN